MSNANQTKQFHISDVISVTSGRLVSKDHVDGVYNILNWMTGDNLMTHQLPRASREVEPFLKVQHPELAAEMPWDTINSRETADAYLETLYPKYGEYVAVAKIPAEDHTTIDPIDELLMIRPDAPIIVVGGGQGKGTK